MLKLGVTGGIGSGKTLVCTIISSMGFPVYNADIEARRIVETDSSVITKIKELFGEDIYIKRTLNRRKVAELAFANPELLESLNAIVHPAVASHFKSWVESYKHKHIVVKEAAILFESGANKDLDKIITVIAPLELRIQRVMERDKTSRESVLSRIQNQFPQEELIKRSDYVIENDGVKLLLPQILNVIKELEKV